MAEYYVISPNGEKYGPADIALLKEWAAQGRIQRSTTIEDAVTGNQYPASMIVDFQVIAPPPLNYQTPAAQPRQERYIHTENHLTKAIISTLCCCLPLGVVAIVYATQVEGHSRRGDVSSAQDAADKASAWANWSIGLTIAWILFYVIVIAANGGTPTRRFR